MPPSPMYPPSGSSSSRRGVKRPTKSQSSDKQLVFSHVEVIPENTGKSVRPSKVAVRHSTSKIKRSPTPVLTSLTELTNAHFHQLSSVWQETSLPSFESDKRAIAASRSADRDPFDF